MKAMGFFGNPSYLGFPVWVLGSKALCGSIHGTKSSWVSWGFFFFALCICLNLLGDGILFLDFCNHIICCFQQWPPLPESKLLLFATATEPPAVFNDFHPKNNSQIPASFTVFCPHVNFLPQLLKAVLCRRLGSPEQCCSHQAVAPAPLSVPS